MPRPSLAEANSRGNTCRSATPFRREASKLSRSTGRSSKKASARASSYSAAAARASSQKPGLSKIWHWPVPGRSTCWVTSSRGEYSSRSWRTTPSMSQPSRSTLLTTSRVGMPRDSKARQSSRVWAWTPSTAESTSTAPSSTVRHRSTSPKKSTWPGVSITWTRTPPQRSTVEADRTEMPRSRSTSSQSVWVVPSSTFPAWRMAPPARSSCSVMVVFPASAWASMPRLMIGSAKALPPAQSFPPYYTMAFPGRE